MDSLMNFNYLLETESETTINSHSKHPSWFEYYDKIINCLFQVAYFVGKEENIESDNGYFLTFAHSHILQFPYSVRAISILLERGYYLESAQIVRHLLEVLVQLRYFDKHRTKLNKYVIKETKITLKTMFDEFNPNLYSKMYYALSEATHGGFGSTIYRTQYKSANDGVTIMGSIYNEMFSNYILNQLIPLIYCLLNYYPYFFIHYKELGPESIENNRKKVLSELKTMMELPPKSAKFLEDIKPLVEFTSK